jgi:hypothetical protein
MNFEFETQKLSKNGITISKGLCVLLIFGIILTFVGLILGLTLGLKKKECDQSDEQKYETCVDLSCRNSSILLSGFLNLKFEMNCLYIKPRSK